MEGILIINEALNEIQACRICLGTDCKLYDASDGKIASAYFEVTSISWTELRGVPPYICYICRALLLKCLSFRENCRRAHEELRNKFLAGHKLTQTDICNLKYKLNHTSLKKIELYLHQYPDEETEIKIKVENEDDEMLLFDEDKLSDNDDYLGTDKNLINSELSDKKIRVDDDLSDDDDVDQPLSSLKEHLGKKIKDAVKFEVKRTAKKKSGKDKLTKNTNRKQLLDKNNAKTKQKSRKINTEKDTWEEKKCYSNVNSSDNDDDVERRLNNEVEEDDDKDSDEDNTIDYDKKFGKYTQKKPSNTEKQRTRRRRSNRPINSHDDFAKKYNFDVKVLTPEEEKVELKARTKLKNYQLAEYTCDLCYRGFQRKTVYEEHLMHHDKSYGDHACEVCRLRFKHRQRLVTHLLFHKFKFVCKQCGQVFRYSYGDHECAVCHLRFRNRERLLKHLLLHKFKFVCKQCGHGFSNSTAAKNHHATHAGVQYECEHCGKTFSRYKSRMEHLRIFHGSITCDICYRGLSNKAAVNSHKTLVHRVTFPCHVCETVFDNEDALNEHTTSAPDGACNQYRACCACGVNFREEKTLKEHIFVFHPPQPKRVGRGRRRRVDDSCCPCKHQTVINSNSTNNSQNNDYNSSNNDNNSSNNYNSIPYTLKVQDTSLNNEITDKTGTNNQDYDTNKDNNYLDDTRLLNDNTYQEDNNTSNNQNNCGNNESKLINSNRKDMKRTKEFDCGCPCKKMKRDDRKDKEARKFMCEMCASASFLSATALKEHQLIHTGEKPHQCNVCSKSFRIKHLLKLHMNIHSDSRPYQCAECGKTFRTSTGRNRHKLIHRGVRRHACSVCEKRFTTSSCLKTHVLHVHMKVPPKPRNRRRNK